MPAVVPFIPLIATGISAAVQLYSDHKKEQAVEHAVDQQIAAGDKAIALQQAEQAKQDALYQPSVALYTGATNLLGQGLGLTMAPTGAMAPGMQTPGSRIPAGTRTKLLPEDAALRGVAPSVPSGPQGPAPVPAPPTFGGQLPSAPPALRGSSYTLPAGLGVPSAVPMIAPDGTPGTVPLSMVAQAEADGFRRAPMGGR